MITASVPKTAEHDRKQTDHPLGLLNDKERPFCDGLRRQRSYG